MPCRSSRRAVLPYRARRRSVKSPSPPVVKEEAVNGVNMILQLLARFVSLYQTHALAMSSVHPLLLLLYCLLLYLLLLYLPLLYLLYIYLLLFYLLLF